MEGAGFRHAVFARAEPRQGGVLRIYLEGDGRPLFDRRLPRPDPTPRAPLALRLMALDPGPAVLLGRPCHHGLADPGCPEAGAGARFSGAVVASLAAAAERLAVDYEGVALIGYSGGAALALALACRLDKARAVVTVAGVVDPAAWAAHHRLPPLSEGPAPACVRELHLIGADDRIAPPALARPMGERRVYPGFDHACCWEQAWPDALAWLGR